MSGYFYKSFSPLTKFFLIIHNNVAFGKSHLLEGWAEGWKDSGSLGLINVFYRLREKW